MPFARIAFKQTKPSLLGPDAVETWVEAAQEGKRVQNGEAVNLTGKTFSSFIENFEAQTNPIPVYLNHFMDEAAGWVRSLERRGKSLWALMEFTADVAQKIKEGKWKFTSIGFSLESVSRDDGDPVGPELFEISLVNEPFIDGMEPVQLSRRERVHRMKTARELIEKALKDGGNLADFESAISAIKGDGGDDDSSPAEGDESGSATQQSGEGADTTLQDETGEDALAAGGEAMAILMEATGLTAAEVLAAVRDNVDALASALVGQAEGDGTPSESVAQSRDGGEGDVQMSRALEMRLAALEKENRSLRERVDGRDRADEEAEVDGWIKQGRILVENRTEVLELLRSKPEHARKVFGKAQAVPVGNHAPEKKPGNGSWESLDDRGKATVAALQRQPMFRSMPRSEVVQQYLSAKANREARMARKEAN